MTPDDPNRQASPEPEHPFSGEPSGNPLPTEPRSFVRRVLGAIQLEENTYDEIATDTGATGQAAIVVGVSAAAQAMGGIEEASLGQLPGALAWGYFSWLLPGTLLWIIARNFLSLEADLIRVLRCIGFATAPQILWLFTLLAPESFPFRAALGLSIFGLGIATNVLALRQAFATTTIKAVQTLLAFAALAVLAGALLGSLLPAP